MLDKMDPRVVAAIKHAVREAISVIGIDGLKQTSLFPSASRQVLKKAA